MLAWRVRAGLLCGACAAQVIELASRGRAHSAVMHRKAGHPANAGVLS